MLAALRADMDAVPVTEDEAHAVKSSVSGWRILWSRFSYDSLWVPRCY